MALHRTANSRLFLPLIGKLIKGWGIDYHNTNYLTPNERELCDQAVREYEFYSDGSDPSPGPVGTRTYKDLLGGLTATEPSPVATGTVREPKRKT